MPRTLIRAPDHDRAKSLGWLALDWIEFFVRHGPGDVQGQPIKFGDEYAGFVVDCYALWDSAGNNFRLYDSAFLSRPKGTNKSGLAAYLALFEALGPARFTGQYAVGGEVYRDPWGLGFVHVYEPGEPIGRHITAPVVRCMATEEGQVQNVYATIHFNVTDDECPLSMVPGIDPGLERINLPFGGDVRISTASSSSKDGGRESFIIYDESHLYNTPELRRMYTTTTRNLRKRKGSGGTWFIETTTMFSPGEESVAEMTFQQAEALREGRTTARHRLLYDHRWGECDDLSDTDKLRAAIVDAFGDAMEWQDLDGLVDEFMDIRSSPADSRRYFLNARTSSSDAWIAAHEWAACARPDMELKDGDLVALGLDGSVRDDATALSACSLSGHVELLGLWEKPPGAEGDGWQVDREAVDAAVAQAMERFEVFGFFMDPAHWQDYADKWHNEYASDMRVRATERRPLEWWCNRPRPMVAALERFHEAVLEKRLTFTPADDRIGEKKTLALALTRHCLNARRAPGRVGVQIRKEHPKSARKIDAIMSAVLAYTAAQDGVAAGVAPKTTVFYPARRLR